MKIVIYSCITNSYDKPKEVLNLSPNIDLVLFSDSDNIKNLVRWDLKKIPKELELLSKVKQQRTIKICPHKYLSEYDYWLWIDGSISIKNANGLIDIFLEMGNDYIIRKHPVRTCIYKEMGACLKLKKESKEKIDFLEKRYEKEGFPKNFGLLESNVIWRKNTDIVNSFDNMWCNEMLNNSHRDQLSFDYCRWKIGNNIPNFAYCDKIKRLLKNDFIEFHKHGS